MNKNNACSISIGGIHTDIAIQLYSNRIFLITSQFQKLGSIIGVNRNTSHSQFVSDVYTTKTLFGQDNEETHAVARYISEKIDIDRHLLISICLKDCSKDTLETIVTAVKQIKPW